MISNTILNTIDTNLNKFLNILKTEFMDLGLDISEFQKPTILCNLTGRTGGQAYHATNTIRLNKEILSNPLHTEDMAYHTVGHELAHLLVSFLYKRHMIKNHLRTIPKSHGAEWKAIMKLLGLKPNRTHNYTVKKVRRTMKIDYTCDCRIHKITRYRHNQCLNFGFNLKCNKCKTMLKVAENATLRLTFD
jgi:SprT protein